MRRSFITVLTGLAAAAGLPLVAGAALYAPGAASATYGYFCALDPVAEIPAEDTISGTVSLIEGPPRLIRQGPLVPAQIGVGFGVIFDLPPGTSGPVTVEVTHPPMGPQSVTRETWVSSATGVAGNYVGFTFDLPYEVRKGAWSFRGTANGRVVFEATFDVVSPGPGLPVFCPTEPVISRAPIGPAAPLSPRPA